jgi:hypothetical protein
MMIARAKPASGSRTTNAPSSKRKKSAASADVRFLRASGPHDLKSNIRVREMFEIRFGCGDPMGQKTRFLI